MSIDQQLEEPLKQQDKVYDAYTKGELYKKYKAYLITFVVILVIISSITILEIVYKSSLSRIKPLMLNIMMVASWFFGLTASGIIKDFLSLKRFENKPYPVFEREKNFMKFLLKIIFLFLTTSLAIWVMKALFQSFFYFVHLFFVEWLLIVYIWFCIENKYKFPWVYTTTINLILLINAYYIYALIYA